MYFSISYSRHIKRISYHTDILTWRRNLLRIETDTNPLTSLQTLVHSSALRRVTYIALQTVLCCSFCVGENISSEIAAFNGGGRMVPPAATGKKKSKKNENLYVCNIVGFFKDYTGISTYIFTFVLQVEILSFWVLLLRRQESFTKYCSSPLYKAIEIVFFLATKKASDTKNNVCVLVSYVKVF